MRTPLHESNVPGIRTAKVKFYGVHTEESQVLGVHVHVHVLHTEEGKVLSRGTELQVGIRVPENPTMSPACARQLVIFCILN